MYYEATTTKGIVIHINVAFSDCVEYLVWPDVRSKHTRRSGCTEFVCWGEIRS